MFECVELMESKLKSRRSTKVGYLFFFLANFFVLANTKLDI